MNIIEDLKQWQLARAEKDAKQFLNLFDGIIGFSFKVPFGYTPGNNNVAFHAYPGVIDGVLNFLIIASSFDTKEKFSESTVLTTSIISANSMFHISDREAVQRIAAWQVGYKEWIKTQLHTEDSIYQAFNIPADDLVEGETIDAYFALAPANSKSKESLADLIISRNGDGSKKINDSFYDLVRPVPPFKPRPWPDKNEFYLLTLL